MAEPTPITPKWVALLQPKTAAQAEAARRYVEHLRAVYRIERRDDTLREPYRATGRLLTTDERIEWNIPHPGLLIVNEGVMQ